MKELQGIDPRAKAIAAAYHSGNKNLSIAEKREQIKALSNANISVFTADGKSADPGKDFLSAVDEKGVPTINGNGNQLIIKPISDDKPVNENLLNLGKDSKVYGSHDTDNINLNSNNVFVYASPEPNLADKGLNSLFTTKAPNQDNIRVIGSNNEISLPDSGVVTFNSNSRGNTVFVPKGHPATLKGEAAGLNNQKIDPNYSLY